MANVNEHISNDDTTENVITITDLHKAFGDNKVINGFELQFKTWRKCRGAWKIRFWQISFNQINHWLNETRPR